MDGLVGVDRLYSVGVVVRDLEAATLRYAEIFGIDEWDVRDFGPGRLTDVTAHGRPAEPTFRTATGTTVPPPGGQIGTFANPKVPVTFELVQPLRGESPFQELRFQRGQGVSHLTLAVQDYDEFAALRGALHEAGLGIAASMTVDGVLERHFVDTRAALGGFLVEVQVPLVDGGRDLVEVTERWNHAGRYTRPEGVGPLTVRGVNHVGIVVQDLMASLERYHRILGVERFNIRNWRTEPGLLDEPYYRGEPVDHAYFTGFQLFKDFGFEIIQPTQGPSHYNREFGDHYGEGIHHLMMTVEDDVENWDAWRDWLASIDVPLAMGSELLGGAAHFCYYDTVASLGGYVLEAVLARHPAEPSLARPEYVVDFTTLL
ncbi:VOC family protein [Aeromicrobium wangtongii]|uniref:VOC family protein n=1 Tax=Aeromicrobium wangtongii TaxID=2969247 RepID=UPI002016B298|nr:VOC family protein [Aeromicrobium wangtongii]MCL3819412.1 VOC family protein [Aeromicrobium wangtongii]